MSGLQVGLETWLRLRDVTLEGGTRGGENVIPLEKANYRGVGFYDDKPTPDWLH